MRTSEFRDDLDRDDLDREALEPLRAPVFDGIRLYLQIRGRLGEIESTVDVAPQRRDQVASQLQLEWQRTPTAVFDQLDAPHETQWFVGEALNVADQAVDRWLRAGRGHDVALLWELDDASRGGWTFSELAAEIDRVGHGLLTAGIGFGDRVGIQLPMVREAVVAQLACAKIGAVSIPIFSGFGAAAVVDRLKIGAAKAHIVANGFTRRGKEVRVSRDLADALAGVDTLAATIVVPLLAEADEPELPKQLAWAETRPTVAR